MPNTSDVLVAREAIVVNVGARPVRYGEIEVLDKRTGQKVVILDTDNEPIDPGDEGVAFAFAAGEKVRADHPAVQECPGAFREIDPTDALVYANAVTTR